MTYDGIKRAQSPMGDVREREVRCCGRYGCRIFTWAYNGVCDSCWAEVADIDAEEVTA